MNIFMTFIARYWKEAIGLVLVAIIWLMWLNISNSDAEIAKLNQEIAANAATAAADNKWQAATADILSKAIADQNAGIDKVLKAVDASSAVISQQMDAKRLEDVKNNAALKHYINNLPKATDCSTMVDNFIKGGGAVKW